MYKTKIFLGNGLHKADDEFNSWSTNNPNIKILNFEYRQQRRNFDHSICILYKELDNKEEAKVNE